MAEDTVPMRVVTMFPSSATSKSRMCRGRGRIPLPGQLPVQRDVLDVNEQGQVGGGRQEGKGRKAGTDGARCGEDG